MKNARTTFLVFLAFASLGAAPANCGCSAITSVRFERMLADKDVTLVVVYGTDRAELPLHGRPIEYLIGPDQFTLMSADATKKVTVQIVPDRYLVDQFGTIHVIVRVADLGK